MKIACITYGMLRNFKNTFKTFERYVLDDLRSRGHEVDVYFAGYANNDGRESCRNFLKENYSCKEPFFMNWDDKTKLRINQIAGDFSYYTAIPGARIEAILSSWYCKNLALYTIPHNKIPDYVILFRPDVYWFRPIDDESINTSLTNDSLMIPQEWDFKCVNPIAVCDAYAMGSYKKIQKFVQCIFHTYNYGKNIKMHAETLCGTHLAAHKLKRDICPRYFAFEKPFGKEDAFLLWKDEWNPTDFTEGDKDRKEYG